MVVENIGLVPTCAISIAAILVPGNVAAFCFFFFFSIDLSTMEQRGGGDDIDGAAYLG